MTAAHRRPAEAILPWVIVVDGRRQIAWVVPHYGIDYRPARWWSPSDWLVRARCRRQRLREFGR